jgi:hypothetical protein
MPSTPAGSVDALLAALDHPHAAAIARLRALILAVDPRITESVKWNAPSFATTDHFATFHLRAKAGVQVVLHLGAKPRPTGVRAEIDDPAGLLEWRAADRATVTFRDRADVEGKAAPFAELLGRWIEFV